MNRALFFFSVVLWTVSGAAASAQDDPFASGRQLAQQILTQLQQTPPQSFTNAAMLEIEHRGQPSLNIPVRFETFVGLTHFVPLPSIGDLPAEAGDAAGRAGWEVIYDAQMSTPGEADHAWFGIYHAGNQSVFHAPETGRPSRDVVLAGNQTMVPFAGSDFWICDLGLEFFQWPDQKIIGHETRRTRACAVLESTNPDPAPGAYSRVVSWIDNETHGIVHAEAYDAAGKLLKEFDPKSFKKVNGHLELQDMEIRNVQTHSRTWMKFSLNSQ